MLVHVLRRRFIIQVCILQLICLHVEDKVLVRSGFTAYSDNGYSQLVRINYRIKLHVILLINKVIQVFLAIVSTSNC